MTEFFEWQYDGDINLQCGGLYWREDTDPDTIQIVQVIPCSDFGKADNEFYIKIGTLYLTVDETHLKSALDFCGVDTKVEGNLTTSVLSLIAYSGFDVDEEWQIRIGSKEYNSHFEEPDEVLRGNSSLRKFVERRFLHKEPKSPSPKC